MVNVNAIIAHLVTTAKFMMPAAIILATVTVLVLMGFALVMIVIPEFIASEKIYAAIVIAGHMELAIQVTVDVNVMLATLARIVKSKIFVVTSTVILVFANPKLVNVPVFHVMKVNSVIL